MVTAFYFIFQVSSSISSFLFQIIGTDYVFFIQKNDLNLKNRNLDIEAQNESFTNRVTVLEKCRYFVSIFRDPPREKGFQFTKANFSVEQYFWKQELNATNFINHYLDDNAALFLFILG